MEMMEKMMEQKQMMDQEMGGGEAAEGGQRERRAGSSRSSSMRSMKSGRSSQRSNKRNQQQTMYQQIVNAIDKNQTPRGSMKQQDISYERGKTSQHIQFTEENKMKVNKSRKNK